MSPWNRKTPLRDASDILFFRRPCRVFLYLEHHPYTSLTHLSRETCIDMAYLHYSLARLEAFGYVSSCRDENLRLLSLTEKGIAVASVLRRIYTSLEAAP